MYIKGRRRTQVPSSNVYATIQSVNCGHSVMNEMQNNRYASISNSITTGSHSGLNEPVHVRISEAEVCFYLMTLSAIHAAQLHMIDKCMVNCERHETEACTAEPKYYPCTRPDVLTAVTEHLSCTGRATVFSHRCFTYC